jgi:MFS family permease
MKLLVPGNEIVAEQPEKTKKYYAHYVFFILFVATLLNGMDSSEFVGASTVIARELHLGINDIGILASAFTIFLTISIIPVGIWADHTRRSYIIAACLAIWSLATALTGIASSFIVLFLTRMFTGIGEAGYAPAGNSLAGDFFKGDKRAKVISWLALASLVGPIAGMVLGGVIAGLSAGSWRVAFLVTGIPGLILAFFAWRMREPSRSQKPQTNVRGAATYDAVKPVEVLSHLKTLLRIKTLICLLGIGVFTTYTATALQTYFPTLLQQHDTFGMTSGQAAIFSGLVLGPTAFGGVILGGYLADWLNRRYRGARLLVCVLSVLITAPLNVASLLIINTHNIPLFCAIMIPSFFINTLHIGPLLTAVLDVVPAEQSASAVAIFVFVQRVLGTALAPLFVGFLARSVDPTGLHFQQNVAGHDLIFALLITCAPAFIIAGLIGLLGLRWVSHDRDVAESHDRDVTEMSASS